MAIAFRSITQEANSDSGTVVITKPSGTADGDVLLAIISANSNTPTAPDGSWTSMGTVLLTAGSRSAAWYKVAGGSEPSSYTFTTSGSSFHAAQMAAYSGVDAAVIDATVPTPTTVTSTSVAAPTITTATTAAMLVCMYGALLTGAFSQPTGMTERGDATTTLFTSSLDEEARPTAGATGTRTSSFSGGSTGLAGFTIALKPAANAPGAPTLDSITAGNAQLSAAFTAGSDGGAAITSYKYSTDNGGTYRTRQTGTTASPILITTLSADGTTPLANGTTYTVLIKAVNSVGDGTASNSLTGTPTNPLVNQKGALMFRVGGL